MVDFFEIAGTLARQLMIAPFIPMPLARRRDAFDDPAWLFELTYDGFRSLAFVDGGGTKLVSRRGLAYRQFRDLASRIALELTPTMPCSMARS